MQTQVINAKNIHLKRGTNHLLKGLSWQVEAGQHWVLLGPNGAGKTLLMEILLGYLWPTLGEVHVLGNRLGHIDLRLLRRSLGWVSKALEEMTPGEASVMEVILSGPLATLGLYEEICPQLQDEALVLAQKFNLEKIVCRHFGLLSSGEKQRVLLARAALAQPKILFLDEPMSNLDLGGRELFLQSLAQMASLPQAPTIILTTHNTLEIGPFMTHGFLMKEGRTVAQGELSSVMCADLLQQTFDLPLRVERASSGRYLALL